MGAQAGSICVIAGGLSVGLTLIWHSRTRTDANVRLLRELVVASLKSKIRGSKLADPPAGDLRVILVTMPIIKPPFNRQSKLFEECGFFPVTALKTTSAITGARSSGFCKRVSRNPIPIRWRRTNGRFGGIFALAYDTRLRATALRIWGISSWLSSHSVFTFIDSKSWRS